MPYIVRVSGSSEAIPVSGRVGALSWGDITSLPLNVPIRVKDIQVGHASADGPYHNKDTGSNRETRVIKTKSADEVIQEILSEYNAFTFKVFNSRDEALAGKTDFELLNVAPNASQQEIKEAYRSLSIIHHPDHNGDPVKFQQISSAYQRLKNK